MSVLRFLNGHVNIRNYSSMNNKITWVDTYLKFRSQIFIVRRIHISNKSCKDLSIGGKEKSKKISFGQKFKYLLLGLCGLHATFWGIGKLSKYLAKAKEETDEYEFYTDPFSKDKQGLVRYKGFWMPYVMISKKTWARVEALPLASSDILVVSYPKSGTTWLQEIIYLLKNSSRMKEATGESLGEKFPYLEFPYPGIDVIEKQPSPRLIKSHLPYELLPRSVASVKPKIIYITRNVKDVTVSYFHFHRMMTQVSYTGKFTDFLENFIIGKVSYDSWWNHVKSYWKRRGSENILILSYEDLHKREVEMRSLQENHSDKKEAELEINLKTRLKQRKHEIKQREQRREQNKTSEKEVELNLIVSEYLMQKYGKVWQAKGDKKNELSNNSVNKTYENVVTAKENIIDHDYLSSEDEVEEYLSPKNRKSDVQEFEVDDISSQLNTESSRKSSSKEESQPIGILEQESTMYPDTDKGKSRKRSKSAYVKNEKLNPHVQQNSKRPMTTDINYGSDKRDSDSRHFYDPVTKDLLSSRTTKNAQENTDHQIKPDSASAGNKKSVLDVKVNFNETRGEKSDLQHTTDNRINTSENEQLSKEVCETCRNIAEKQSINNNNNGDDSEQNESRMSEKDYDSNNNNNSSESVPAVVKLMKKYEQKMQKEQERKAKALERRWSIIREKSQISIDSMDVSQRESLQKMLSNVTAKIEEAEQKRKREERTKKEERASRKRRSGEKSEEVTGTDEAVGNYEPDIHLETVKEHNKKEKKLIEEKENSNEESEKEEEFVKAGMNKNNVEKIEGEKHKKKMKKRRQPKNEESKDTPIRQKDEPATVRKVDNLDDGRKSKKSGRSGKEEQDVLIDEKQDGKVSKSPKKVKQKLKDKDGNKRSSSPHRKKNSKKEPQKVRSKQPLNKKVSDQDQVLSKSPASLKRKKTVKKSAANNKYTKSSNKSPPEYNKTNDNYVMLKESQKNENILKKSEQISTSNDPDIFFMQIQDIDKNRLDWVTEISSAYGFVLEPDKDNKTKETKSGKKRPRKKEETSVNTILKEKGNIHSKKDS